MLGRRHVEHVGLELSVGEVRARVDGRIAGVVEGADVHAVVVRVGSPLRGGDRVGHRTRGVDPVEAVGAVIGQEIRIVGVGRVGFDVGVAVAVPAGGGARHGDHLRFGRDASGDRPAEELADGAVPGVDHGRDDGVALHVALHRDVLAHRGARGVGVGEQLRRRVVGRCRRVDSERGVRIGQIRVEDVARVVGGHAAGGRCALHVERSQIIARRTVEQVLVRACRKHELGARCRERVVLAAAVYDSELVEGDILPDFGFAAGTPAVLDLGGNLLADRVDPLGHAVVGRDGEFHALAFVVVHFGRVGRNGGVRGEGRLSRHRRKVVRRNQRDRVAVVVDHALDRRFVGGEGDDFAFVRLLDVARHAEVAFRAVGARQREPVLLRQVQRAEPRRDEAVVVQIRRDPHFGDRGGVRRVLGVVVRDVDHDPLLPFGRRGGEFGQRVVLVLPGGELCRDAVEPQSCVRGGQLVRLMAAAQAEQGRRCE